MNHLESHVKVIHVTLAPPDEKPAALAQLISEYRETAVWADRPEEENWDDARWSPEALEKATADCAAFYSKACRIIEELEDEHPFGHDFWLTRQGHGAGFWDGDYPEPAGEQLTEISKTFGETDIYVGDDGWIHLGGER